MVDYSYVGHSGGRMKPEKCIEFYLPMSVVWMMIAWAIEERKKIQVQVPGVGLLDLKPLTYSREEHLLYFGAMEVVTDSPQFKLADSESGLVSGVFEEGTGRMCLRNGPPPLPQPKVATESGSVHISRYLARS